MDCDNILACTVRWCEKNKGKCLLKHLESTNSYVSPYTYNFFKQHKKANTPKITSKTRSSKEIARRKKIWNKTNGICYLCNLEVKFEEMTIDHKKPKSKGGSNKLENLFPTHKYCNETKADKII